MDQLLIHMEVIGLDFDKLEKEFDESFADAWSKLADRIEKEWQDLASQQLKSSKDQYLQGLKVEKVGNELIQASLTGFIPVAVEEGISGYDMKKGLLGGNLARVVPIGKRAGDQPPRFTVLTPDSRGWQHPGIKARQLHQQVQTLVDEKLVNEIFGDAVSRISV